MKCRGATFHMVPLRAMWAMDTSSSSDIITNTTCSNSKICCTQWQSDSHPPSSSAASGHVAFSCGDSVAVQLDKRTSSSSSVASSSANVPITTASLQIQTPSSTVTLRWESAQVRLNRLKQNDQPVIGSYWIAKYRNFAINHSASINYRK